jgi:hypothetical protein
MKACHIEFEQNLLKVFGDTWRITLAALCKLIVDQYGCKSDLKQILV